MIAMGSTAGACSGILNTFSVGENPEDVDDNEGDLEDPEYDAEDDVVLYSML